MRFSFILFVIFGLILNSCDSTVANKATHESAEINWLSWDEAVKKNKDQPKKIFIDMYTDWCGWCKKMDKSTFIDKDVVALMNENYYAIKFDAEQKEDILYKGHTFSFVPSGRKGYHQLAAAFLNGKLSYPSFVFLNEREEVLFVSPGYKQASEMVQELTFAAENKFMNQTLSEYKAGN